MKEVLADRRAALCRNLILNGVTYALITKPSHIMYFTGSYIVPYERFVGLIFSVETQKNYLIIPELEKGLTVDTTVEEIFYRDEEDPFLKLLNVTMDAHVLGVEKNDISYRTMEKIRNINPKLKDFFDLGNLIEEMKMIKDSNEINAIRKASQYTDEILREVKKTIRVGTSEKRIKYELLRSIAETKGVQREAFEIQVSSGPNAARPHGVTGDRQLEAGDSVLIDFGVNYAHYKSDITRTFFMGRPSRQMEEIYNTVLDAQLRAIDAIRPGRPIREIDNAARETIEAKGYGDCFIHRTGHGLGIDIHEIPSICNTNEKTIQEGMMFSVEPGIYVPELGGVRIEDVVLVTISGGKTMTCFPKELADVIISL